MEYHRLELEKQNGRTVDAGVRLWFVCRSRKPRPYRFDAENKHPVDGLPRTVQSDGRRIWPGREMPPT